MNYNLYSKDIEELTAHLNAGVSPFHTVQYSAELLKGRGFEELKLDAPWFPKAGMGYFVNIFDTTLAAFVIGRDITAAESGVPSLRIAASHTDWPCLMVKPSPELTCGSYAKLNVSVYGGPILNTWLDRPLSMAGKVCLRSPDPFQPEVLLVDFARPLLTVPNLAIHFNREVNKGVELNPQKDMQPLLAVLDETLNKDSFSWICWQKKRAAVRMIFWIINFTFITVTLPAGWAFMVRCCLLRALTTSPRSMPA